MTTAIIAIAVLGLIPWWSRAAITYADPSVNTRAVPDTKYLVWQVLLAMLGVSASVACGVTGLAHARSGSRRCRRVHRAMLPIIIVTLPIWLLMLFIIGSA